jgi:putative flippase GtrA
VVQISSTSLAQLWRYYKVGVVNTLFGYGLYALLIMIGLHMYVAQIVGHIIAVAFNYLTYSRHVFRGAPVSRQRFLLSYALNYLVSLVSLSFSAALLTSPYLAGLLAMLISSALNFIVLRRYVFAAPVTSGDNSSQVLPPTPIAEKMDHASCG